MIVILNFGLCQCRLAVGAPINGLFGFVDVSLLHHISKQANLDRLVLWMHGDVRIIPISPHAQALELPALDVHLLQRVGCAALPELRYGQSLPFLAQRPHYMQLNGQAVGIPTGHIGYMVPRQGAGPQDDVFQDFVQGRADVNVPIGVRRAIMQDKRRPVLRPAQFLQLSVIVLRVPLLQHGRFPLGQIPPHRKVCHRQL